MSKALRTKKNPPNVEFGNSGGLLGLGSLGEVVNAAQVIDKTLIAKTVVQAWYDVDKSKFFRTFAPKQTIGRVYTYIQKNGVLWWMIYPEGQGKSYYYVPHVPGAFDLQALQQQGTKTVLEEKQAEEQKKLDEKPFIDKIIDKGAETAENAADIFANTSKVMSYVVPGAMIAGVLLIGFSLYNNADKITSKLTK